MILWKIKDLGQYHAIVQDAPSVRKKNLVVASLHITPVLEIDAARRRMANSPQSSWGKGGGDTDN